MTTPRKVALILCIGLVAASQSGNIIRIAGDVPAVSISAWRLLIATLLLLPLAGSDLSLIAKLNNKEKLLLVLSGVALAFHFFAWIAAVQLTTVANAAVFFSVNPIMTAGAAYLFFREKAGKRLYASIGLGLTGVVIIGGCDLCFSKNDINGDLMALLCSALFTVYFLLGKRLRKKIPTSVYVTYIYGVAAAVSFVVLLCLDLPIFEYSSNAWICFGLLALLPTLMGHTSINYAVHYIKAGVISAATLTEPLLAGLVAWIVYDESISIQTAVGYVFIVLSVLVLVFLWMNNFARRTT